MKITQEYERLFDAVPCGILELEMPITESCQVLKMNRRAVEILKLYPDQAAAKILLIPEHMDEHNRKIAATILSQMKKIGDKETFLLSLYHGTIQGEAELTGTKNHPVMRFIFMEIGQEIAIRRREAAQGELLESVLQSVRCGVVRFGFRDNEQKIILVNKAGWNMLGFSSEEECKEQGMNGFLPRVHQEDRKILLKTHCTLKEDNEKKQCEFRLYDSDGSIRWLSAEEQYLRDLHGSSIIQMTMMDITPQKLQMEKKEEENGEIIQSLGMMYFIILYVDAVSDTYQVIKSNYPYDSPLDQSYSKEMFRQVERLCRDSRKEHEKEEIKKKYIAELSLTQFKKRFCKKQSLWEQDFQFGEEDNLQYYRVEAVMSGEGNCLRHIVMGLRDVTELRRKEWNEQQALRMAYEAATQASYAKTEFLSRMSHDIRTPMNAIVGLTQLMKNHLEEPEKLEDYLGKVEDSSELLLELINDVLDMSRIESGKVILEEQPMDLWELAERIQVIIHPDMEKHGHTFLVENHLPKQNVVGDGLRIQQMLLNILSNAVKFTPDGGKIYWKLWAEKNTNKRFQNVHFLIEDNGIGMTEEFLNKIYQPFEREGRKSVREIQGSGLGMAIVSNFVQLMNGWIDVSSTLGVGSTFHIVLPLRTEQILERTGKDQEEFRHENKQEDSQGWSKNSVDKPDLTGKRILLAEDNKINRLIAREILCDTKAEIEEAENGREALNLFLQHESGYYDLIFMDVRMPIMNGYEATSAIRQSTHEDAIKIPIIAMTANAFAEDIKEANCAGMNDHLAKPVQIGRLYQMLFQYLKHKNREGGTNETQ